MTQAYNRISNKVESDIITRDNISGMVLDMNYARAAHYITEGKKKLEKVIEQDDANKIHVGDAAAMTSVMMMFPDEAAEAGQKFRQQFPEFQLYAQDIAKVAFEYLMESSKEHRITRRLQNFMFADKVENNIVAAFADSLPGYDPEDDDKKLFTYTLERSTEYHNPFAGLFTAEDTKNYMAIFARELTRTHINKLKKTKLAEQKAHDDAIKGVKQEFGSQERHLGDILPRGMCSLEDITEERETA